MRVKASASAAALRLAGFGLLLLIWALASTQLETVRLPGPGVVSDAMRDNFFIASRLQLQGLEGGYLQNVLYTVRSAFTAFLAGASLGFAVGILSARLQVVRDASTPVLVLFATVPELIVLPFFIVWLGPGQNAQRLLVGFFAFVIIAITSQNAALTLDPRYEESAAALGASARLRMFTILVPGSLPAITGAVRVALASAWGLQTIGELLGSRAGVGRVIFYSQQLAHTQGTIAVILLLAGFAITIDAIVIGVLRWLTRWQESISQ